MIWLGRNDVPVIRSLMANILGTEVQQESTGTPELDACLKDRGGAVDKMREEGVISAVQYNEFRQRAVDYCEAQFSKGSVVSDYLSLAQAISSPPRMPSGGGAALF